MRERLIPIIGIAANIFTIALIILFKRGGII